MDNLVLKAVPIQHANFPAFPSFFKLPDEEWSKDNFSVVTESQVKSYLKVKEDTLRILGLVFVCVSACDYFFSLEMANSGNCIFIKAMCRPTMCQVPSFYSLFIKLDSSSMPILPSSGNYKCPAGKSQNWINHWTAPALHYQYVSKLALH